MKRILINATHNEEVRVALCKGNHLYDFDLENRTREQKKSNIYKGHVTRVEPSLEAVFVEYGSKRQGFLPIREIANEYLSGNPREENIRKLIKEGDELIVQVEKEERGNKGAALSTYVSLAGRYLVLMPNNPKGGGISRQISGKLREDMKRMLGNLNLPKGMSVIVRTAGIGKTQDDLQHDLNHLLNIWNAIQEQNKKYASPRLVHQEAGVVTRAVRDYLRDDISEIWIDNEEAFIEAETFIKAVMPTQIDKLRKYTDFEPMFSSFSIERQIETAYQREVRLPSGGSIVIDQTEALVSIDINSAKSTKGADVSETAYHTNLEAADEIARQLRLRDMGGLIVIDFIDMNDNKHQKEVEKRLVEATKYDRARVQFGDISRFGLMEMSRQRLRPSLEEATGYICPRCHGNGMIRDLRSLSLSIMRQIEQTALKERHGEVQAEVPTDIAAFLLNEKRESLVYLEQDSGTRITILPHAHLESPNFNLHFNHQGFAPASYERITDTQQQETSALGYDVDWQTAEAERPEQQPSRQPRETNASEDVNGNPSQITHQDSNGKQPVSNSAATTQHATHSAAAQVEQSKPAAVAWLANLFAPTPQAKMSATVSSADAAQAIEEIVNTGAESRGAFGQVNATALASTTSSATATEASDKAASQDSDASKHQSQSNTDGNKAEQGKENDKDRRRSRNNRNRNNKNSKRGERSKQDNRRRNQDKSNYTASKPSHDSNNKTDNTDKNRASQARHSQKELPKREPNSKRESRGAIERTEAKQPKKSDSHTERQSKQANKSHAHESNNNNRSAPEREVNPKEVNLRVTEAEPMLKEAEVVHISLDDTNKAKSKSGDQKPASEQDKADTTAKQSDDSNDPVSSAESKERTQASKASSDSDSRRAESSTASTIDSQKQSADDNTQADKHSEFDSDSATLTFDPDTVFADRYIAAKKFGKASNDPRVIKQALEAKQHKQQLVHETSSHQQTPTTLSINGTVGQFIHTHLAQPRMRLAKDGVITCFLAALNAYKETSGIKSLTHAHANVVENSAPHKAPQDTFSFANYGYESLSPSYLEHFAQMTSAVAAYDTKQGKTDVAPLPITTRASNDPRGQHPDLVSQEIQQAEVVAEQDKDLKQPEAAADKSPAQAMTELLQLNVGDFVNKMLGEEGVDMLHSGQTEAAFLKALRQPWDKLISIAQKVDNQAPATVIEGAEEVSVGTLVDTPATDGSTVDAAIEHAADVLTSEPQADSISEGSEELLHPHDPHNTAADDSNRQINLSLEEEDQSDSDTNKTSIESYKSMIENISEQLLPQTGLLNLTSPKVPKTRSRKVKEESKDEEE